MWTAAADRPKAGLIMNKNNYRKNIRLQNYHYKTNGYYFVTICTDYRKPYLEDVCIKNIVVAELARLTDMKGVNVNYYVVMPDHIHLIIVLEESQYSLFEIVKRFKSKTTILTNKSVKQDGQLQKIADQGRQLQKTVAQGCRLKRLWQPNYYEHIIRNEKALSKIREYIRDNPEREKYDWNDLEDI